MDLRIKGLAFFWRDHRDAVLREHVQQFAQSQLNAFLQSRIGFAFGFFRGFQGALKVVVDRQHVARHARAAIGFGFAAVAVRALAGIFSLCEGAHPPVTHVIPLGNQGFDLRVCRVVFFRSKIDITALFGDFRDIELLFFSRVRHHGLLSSVRQDPAHCLGRVIHNRNDPSVIQSCRADNPYGADNLSIRVHIRTDDQRGTRK